MEFKLNKHELKLFIVATPIGNIEEISQRALVVLKTADAIFCEDTRNARHLLSLLKIKVRLLIRCDDYTENNLVEKIAQRIKEGQNCVLISDAGYPLICDPGVKIVQTLYSHNIAVEVINGPSALIHALVVSGFAPVPFTFWGFLPYKSQQLKKELTKVLSAQLTSVVYEAPHRIVKTLHMISEINDQVIICVVKELTKLHETIYRGTASEILPLLVPKGEFVIIFPPHTSPNIAIEESDLDSVIEEVRTNYPHLKQRELAKILASKTDLSVSKAYEALKK